MTRQPENKSLFKICSLCRQNKKLDDFHRNKNNKYGHHQQCKTCRSTIEKQRRKNDPEYKKHQNKLSLNYRIRKHRTTPTLNIINENRKQEVALIKEWQENGYLSTDAGDVKHD